MLEPREDFHGQRGGDRSHERGNGAEPPPFALPSPPPGLSSRPGQRPLRILPSPADDGAARGNLQLRSELEAARNELNALQDMLEELPAILERKFQHRLHGLLEHQRALIARNQSLREQLLALTASPATPPLPEGGTGGMAGGLRRSVQWMLGSAAKT